MRKTSALVLVGAFVGLGAHGAGLEGAAARTADPGQRELRRLRLIVVLTKRSGDVEFFDRTLTSDDIVFTYGAKRDLLARITRPRTMFGRSSVAAIEEGLRRLGSVPVDYVQYNPEQWGDSRTPREEIEDLLGAVRRVRELAEAYGAKLSFTTDHVLLEKYGRGIAPLVDMFGIQLQRYQRDGLEEFREQAARLAAIVRSGSPTVPIFFQISLAPPKWEIRAGRDGATRKVHLRDERGQKVCEALPMQTVLRQIEAIADLADGIAFLYDEGTRGELRRLVAELRE